MRKFVKLSEALDEVMKKHDPNLWVEWKISENYQKIFGKGKVQIKFSDGTLFVKCYDSMQAFFLRSKKDELKRKINGILGQEVVDNVVVLQVEMRRKKLLASFVKEAIERSKKGRSKAKR